ncbi:MAG: HAD family hydrolase [Enterococcus sp.]
MAKVKGIIFDMDGLLFDSELVYYQATQTVADKLNIPYQKADYLSLVGISDAEVWQRYHELFDQDCGVELVNHFIQEAYQETLTLFEAGKAPLKPGVHELLNFLAEQKIPRVVASSNQRQVIEQLLMNAGIFEHFSEIISAENVQRAKPDPEIFEIAQQKLGIEKENLLILEDSHNGVLAAFAAEIPVVMIPDLIPATSEHERLTLAIKHSLHEIEALITHS